MSSGSNKVKDGRLVVAPPLFRAFRLGEFPDHPTSRSYIVDWPSALTKDKSAPSLYVVVLVCGIGGVHQHDAGDIRDDTEEGS